MARISEQELNRLKQALSLQRIVESSGIVLKRHGADLIGTCPFHNDKSPSLVVTPKTNLWHCLGACQTGGSVIDWVMKIESVSFRHAVELLQNDHFPSLAAGSSATLSSSTTAIATAATTTTTTSTPAQSEKPIKPVKHSTVQKLPTTLINNADDDKLLVQVIDYYHRALKDSPDALAYLQKRKIGSAEAIDSFKLGYANRTLGYRLPFKNRKEGAAIRGQLQRIGILRPSGHEHFNGSLVIPIMNEAGQVTEVYGRKMGDQLRKGTPLHCYLPGAHAGIWNEIALKASPEIILCEALIDALTFWCAGYRNVTASYGIEGFTADHLAAFKHYGTKRVLIAYDRDDAGNRGAEKLATQLIESGIDCYRLQFPKDMDANSYALQVEAVEESLGKLIRNAVWLGKGKAQTQAQAISTEITQPDKVPAKVEHIDQTLPSQENKPVKLKKEEKEEIREKEKKEQKEQKEATKDKKKERRIPPEDEKGKEVEQVIKTEKESEKEIEKEEETEILLPATPVPETAGNAIEVEIKTVGDVEELIINLGDRRYRIRGLDKNLNYAQLKINLLVSRPAFDGSGHGTGNVVHVDTLDCYQSRPRTSFIKQAAIELGLKEEVIKHDLGKILLKLESIQEQRLQSSQTPITQTIQLTDEESQTALALLKSPDLLKHIQEDFKHCGIVGEDTNTLTSYLACVSRKLDKPLAILIQSTSAAGKSALMDAVLNLMPEEERIQYSAMTGQSLFYLGESDLKHKILGIAEEEGVSEASYALKLLQSQGELTIATTGKDPQSGKMITQEYHVEGPVMIFLTTTAIELDEELLNRCLILTVNESREQTDAIQHQQRFEDTLEGLLAKQTKDNILTLHRNAQRLLKPLKVVNPYAGQLTFLSDKTRTRRDHAKYLTLIKTITLLHQYQRKTQTIQHQGQIVDYIEVTLDDIETANQIAHEVLGRTLDELPPQTRRLLNLLHEHIQQDCKAQQMQHTDYRFSRRDVREFTGWGDTQLKVHLQRLVELEYCLVHRSGHSQRHVYELLYDGTAGKDKPHLNGLLDVSQLKKQENELKKQLNQKTIPEYDTNRSEENKQRSAVKANPSSTGRGEIGTQSVGGRGHEKVKNPNENNTSSGDKEKIEETKESAQLGRENDMEIENNREIDNRVKTNSHTAINRYSMPSKKGIVTQERQRQEQRQRIN